MSIHLSEILLSIMNLIIFYLILRIFFFNKIKNVMEERNNIIRDNIDKAILDREEAEGLLEKAQTENRNAKEKGIQIISEHKKKAELLYEDILSEARDEAKSIVERGSQDALREKEEAKKDIRKNIVEMSTILSQKVIGETATPEIHEKLIDEVLSQIGDE